MTIEGVPVGVLGPGKFFGAVTLLDPIRSGGRSPATITAVSDMVIEVLSVPEFLSLLAVAPTVCRRLREEVSRRTDLLRDVQDELTVARQLEREHALVA